MSSKKSGKASCLNQLTKYRNLFQVKEKNNSPSMNKDNKTPKQTYNYRSCSVDKKRSSFQLEIMSTKVKAKDNYDSAKTQRINNKKFKPIISYSYQNHIGYQLENEMKHSPLKISDERNKITKYHYEGHKTPMSTKLQQRFSLLPAGNQLDPQPKNKKTKFNHSIDSHESFSKTFQFQKREFNRIITTYNAIKFLGNDFISKTNKGRLSLDAFEEVEYIGLLFSYFEHKKINKSIQESYQELNKREKVFELVFVSKDVSDKEFLENYQSLPGLALPYEKTHKHAKDLIARFEIKSLPSLIVIDKQGKVIVRHSKTKIMNHWLKRLINISQPQNVLGSNIIAPKLSDFKDFIKQFTLAFITGEEASRTNLLHLCLIAYYKPSKDKMIRLKEESILSLLYSNVNTHTWQIGLIIVRHNESDYKSLKNDLHNRKLFPLMQINCDLTHYESKDFECDGLMICDNKQNIITREGFSNIKQYQYEVFAYWSSQLNKQFNSKSSLNANNLTQSLGNLFNDKNGNLYSSLPNKDLVFIHLYSTNTEGDILITRDICNYLYSILKTKITFVNINVHQQFNQIANESNAFAFSGLYIQNPSKGVLDVLAHRFGIELTAPALLPKVILTTNDFQIIKEYNRSDIVTKGVTLFSNIANPSFFFNSEKIKHVLNHSFNSKDGKRTIDLLATYNLICLYFGDSESKKSKSFTSALVGAYNSINRIKKRIEIIYYPQNKTLRHLRNETKEVPFPCCDFDSNDIYGKYNKNKKSLKLMIIDLNGNIIIDNAVDDFIAKGEALFKEIFNNYLGFSYATSTNCLEVSFLGEEFIDKKGKRVTRDHLLNSTFIGLYFYSLTCPFSHQRNIELEKFVNQIQSSSPSDFSIEESESNKETVEIILNPIDNDKEIYYSLGKLINCLIVPYDYKDVLINTFKVVEIGVPTLFIFDSFSGDLITMDGVEDISLSPLKAFDKWKTVK